MVLQNVNIVGQDEPSDIEISNEKISAVAPNGKIPGQNKGDLKIVFDNAIAFPGLINSHDHLEFNLFPQLGNTFYRNYIEWGADIHKQNKKIIDSILKIPEQFRVQWGIYKNLINGFTTVVHHGKRFKIPCPLINVFQNSYSLHSVRLEKKLKLKLNRPFAKNQPFVIHVGEGTDTGSLEEINELIRWNLFNRKLIAVHGVAMNAQQAKAFDALIWCPDSNFFLLNTTARVNELKKETKVLFGTDSTVSANWNAWEQIRLAQKTMMLTDTELIDSLTKTPSTTWGIAEAGSLNEKCVADIVIASMKNQTDLIESFFQIDIEDILLIIRKGKIIYFDEILSLQLNGEVNFMKFSKIIINDAVKYIIGNITELIKQIKNHNPEIKFPIEIP